MGVTLLAFLYVVETIMINPVVVAGLVAALALRKKGMQQTA
jgi:hypothetical protein